jgi:hypothetical protein
MPRNKQLVRYFSFHEQTKQHHNIKCIISFPKYSQSLTLNCVQLPHKGSYHRIAKYINKWHFIREIVGKGPEYMSND